MRIVTRYYYLDASIGNLEDFEALFKRAQSFAARALERLTDPPLDTEFARVFEYIFKTPVTDVEPMTRSINFKPTDGQGRDHKLRPVLAHVCRELYSFANDWARTWDRRQAEVRIHFNEAHRYVQHQGELFDPVNHLFAFRNMEYMEWLWYNANAFVSYRRPLDPSFNPRWEHPRRNVIDFTEVAQYDQSTWGKWTRVHLFGISVDFVAADLLETILIHEMMHCAAYSLQDFCNANGGTGGWGVIMGATKQQSYICAESIAMLCLAAALADLHPMDLPSGYRYTISRDGIIDGY